MNPPLHLTYRRWVTTLSSWSMCVGTRMSISKKPIACKNLRGNFTKFVRATNKEKYQAVKLEVNAISPLIVCVRLRMFIHQDATFPNKEMNFTGTQHIYWQFCVFRFSWLHFFAALFEQQNDRLSAQLVGKIWNGSIYFALSSSDGQNSFRMEKFHVFLIFFNDIRIRKMFMFLLRSWHQLKHSKILTPGTKFDAMICSGCCYETTI